MRSTPLPGAAEALAAAWAALRLGAAQTLAGWPVLIGRCLFYVLLMIILTGLWDRVAAEHLAGTLAARTPVGGFGLYVGATEWITLALPALHLRLEDDIRSGALETHLLRPKPYLLQTVSQGLGAVAVRMAFLGVTAIMLLALSGRPWPAPQAFGGVVVLGALGVSVGVLLYTLAGLTAFWVRRTLPFQLIVQKLMFVMGGLFAPITLYPPILRRLSEASPFAAHLYWAGIQAVRPSAALFVRGLAWDVLWLAVLAGACIVLWRAGVAKVLREGGA